MSIVVKGKNITKKIDKIIEDLKGINKEVAQIARSGLDVAKLNLAKGVQYTNFTQKHGEQLVNEIGLVEISPNNYQIVAPISGNQEIVYEMYFAEYGAGIGRKNSLDKSLKAKSGYVPKYVHKDGYWLYKDLNGEVHRVNTSTPINFMFIARSVMRREMKDLSKKLKTKIRTRIKRNW